MEGAQRAEPQHVRVLQSMSLLFDQVLANKKSSFSGVGLRWMITDHRSPCGIKVAFILEANREITQAVHLPSYEFRFCEPFLMEELTDLMLSPPKMFRNGQGS